MLETLVSSRIRRTLLEHILARPSDRFYLRGLAKELGLSVSPLRRELKRLERLDLLRTVQEGNMLFYTVNPASPTFLQLEQAGRPTEAPSPLAAWPQAEFGVRGSGFGVRAHSPEPTAQSVQAIPVGVVSPRSASFWRSPLSSPALIGAGAVGVALLFIVGLLLYVTVTNQRLASVASRSISGQKAGVTVVAPPVPAIVTGGPGPAPALITGGPGQPSASGTMRGARWRNVPGGFGGFSSGSSSESY